MLYSSEKVDLELSVERTAYKLALEDEIERGLGSTVGNTFLFPRKCVSFSLTYTWFQ